MRSVEATLFLSDANRVHDTDVYVLPVISGETTVIRFGAPIISADPTMVWGFRIVAPDFDAEIRRLQARVDELSELLAETCWTDTGCCESCGGLMSQGHDENCPILLALDRA